jgi:hypothetical protein
MSGCILHNLCILHHDDVERFIEEDGNGANPNVYPNIYLDGGQAVVRRNELLNALV